MRYTIFDIETDGLLDSVTRIHCLCYRIFDNTDLVEEGSIVEYDEISKFILSQEVLIGHNIIRYDIPVINKILNIHPSAKLYDSLAISWYLYPNKDKHGLEDWGEYFGIPKPKIADWSNLTTEEYIHRCKEDVKINSSLWHKQLAYLSLLYPEVKDAFRFLGYLTFKLDCAREQEEIKLKIDILNCKKNLEYLTIEKQKRVDILSNIMPPKIQYRVASRPKVLYKKDGEVSEHGKKWFKILQDNNLPEYHLSAVKIPTNKVEKGNPNSHIQVKDWLFSLGWIPDVFKYEKDDDGNIRKIPQISEEGDITQSVKNLLSSYPQLQELAGYYVISHRIGVLEGFLSSVDSNDFVKAEISGLTNTLRMQHKKPIANLPSIPKPYWEAVRSCIISPYEEYVLCGSDMSSLEDNTKQHYMYFFDPDYVKEMRVPGFDPHLDIGIRANMLTEEEAEMHKLYDKTKGAEGKSFKAIRSKAKKVNFAGVYGAGPPKIALTANIPLSEAKLLHTTYWERNKAVKLVAQSCRVQEINGQMWLFNPVSQFWYSLRALKDRFSTLNQGTGVYCFDTWVKKVRSKGIKIAMQYHDEIAFPLLITDKEIVKQKLKEAIDETNNSLRLNVELGISIDFGDNYAAIH